MNAEGGIYSEYYVYYIVNVSNHDRDYAGYILQEEKSDPIKLTRHVLEIETKSTVSKIWTGECWALFW